MATKIYISPSNQYANAYAYGNTTEMEQCNRIAVALEKHLKRNGYEVKRAPKGQHMNVSIRESNNWGADVHIPIHTNAGGGKGALVMVYSITAGNLKYAQPVYDALKAISPNGGGYGVRTDVDICKYTLGEVQDTNAIAVYVEAEFHDNANLAKWIINNVDNIAVAIAKGICKADGKTYKAESATTTEKKEETVRTELKRGDKGIDVLGLKYLMMVAADMGIVKVSLAKDGGFGNGTENAVKALQKLFGMSQTGVANESLIHKLYEKINSSYPVKGDVNRDGVVNIQDATAIQKHLAGLE